VPDAHGLLVGAHLLREQVAGDRLPLDLDPDLLPVLGHQLCDGPLGGLGFHQVPGDHQGLLAHRPQAMGFIGVPLQAHLVQQGIGALEIARGIGLRILLFIVP